MSGISYLIDLWGILGIGLEIWGFVWLLWYPELNRDSLRKWFFKHREPKTEDSKWASSESVLDWISLGLRDSLMAETDDFQEARKFVYSRRKWAIRLVIVGLLGQVAQIVHGDLSEFLCNFKNLCL